ncbi:hypothetical protein EGK_13102 [Macaca mulatta]|uniref:Uncharacterized protein n=1 Tax=Macaca mulatta TaxID=9544 RepID=G7NPH7_MACMU|nr:hypothetical protein EGK_13102 [Macaca mulatta]
MIGPQLPPSARCCGQRRCWRQIPTSAPSHPGDTVWTQTRTAIHKSWPSPSACAEAASTHGPAARQLRSTPCGCSRVCWCCAAGPAPTTARGSPRPGPSPSTPSSFACLSAVPACCPGQCDRRGCGAPRLDTWAPQRAPPIYVYLLLFICLPQHYPWGPGIPRIWRTAPHCSPHLQPQQLGVEGAQPLFQPLKPQKSCHTATCTLASSPTPGFPRPITDLRPPRLPLPNLLGSTPVS